MLRIRSALSFFAVCLAVSACAAQVQHKEDMLAAAGFTLVPANTPSGKPHWPRCRHINSSTRCATTS